MTGRFLTFEGGEGSGKSTQLARLGAALKERGLPVVTTREPGGSPGAEQIRNMLVSGEAGAWSPVAETLLFTAARCDHVERVIKPALETGTNVLCDRFFDSTLVYQGIGKGLGESYVTQLHQLAIGSFTPDLTLIFDIDPLAGLARAAERRGGEGRFESLPVDFHQMVRAGFLQLAQRAPERYAVIDASGDISQVEAQVHAVLRERMGWAL